MLEGQVLKSTGSFYEVATRAGGQYRCRTRGKMRLLEQSFTNPVAVGDWVRIQPGAYEDDHRIIEVLPRENVLVRKANKSTSRGQILAANVDLAVVVVSMVAPETSQGFIDRFLVASEAYNVTAYIVFNKVDLYKEVQWKRYQALKDLYEELGYVCFATVATANSGVDSLLHALQGCTSLFCGHSGVGKSTVLNAMNPHLAIRTAQVSESHQKGRHTTTHAQMHVLDPNTQIIDTPGIREYGLLDYEAAEMGHYLPEIRRYLGQCRFNNCTHVHEPGCSVREALEEGAIHPWRYESYLSMLDNQDQYH